MGKRAAVVLGAVIITLSACGGSERATSGPTGTATSRPAISVPNPPTTARPTSTTTTSRPEFSFDDSVPPPKLVNTGTNYVEILKSLARYGNWLAAYRPDPSLVSEIAARGTKVFTLYTRDVTRLRDNGSRAIETLGGPSRYKILTATPDAFSAVVVEDIREHRTVTRDGRETSSVRFTAPTTYLKLFVKISDHWYLASLEVQHSVNVHL